MIVTVLIVLVLGVSLVNLFRTEFLKRDLSRLTAQLDVLIVRLSTVKVIRLDRDKVNTPRS